jgi:chromosome segregation ATPase
MYDRCRALCDTQQRALEVAETDLASTRASLTASNARAADIARVLEETQVALHAQIESKTQEASAATRAVTELRGVVAGLQERAAGLERDVAARDGRISELTAAVAERDGALAAQGADMAVLKAQ